MPLIETINPEKANGDVAGVYGDIAKTFGRGRTPCNCFRQAPPCSANSGNPWGITSGTPP